jgi:hypothetical protein
MGKFTMLVHGPQAFMLAPPLHQRLRDEFAQQNDKNDELVLLNNSKFVLMSQHKKNISFPLIKLDCFNSESLTCSPTAGKHFCRLINKKKSWREEEKQKKLFN